MASKTADNVKTGLKGLRGAGDAVRGGVAQTVDQAFDPQPDHPKTKGNVTRNHAIAEKGEGDLHDAGQMLSQHRIAKGPQGARQPLPSGRPVPAARNYDEAPPGQPGPDFSGSIPKKPAFTRGPSMIDETAITSAAPTPAGEIADPMRFGVSRGGARQRESHLPDLDIRDADFSGNGTFKHSDDEIRGTDEFGPELSRQETEKPRERRGTTTKWEGW